MISKVIFEQFCGKNIELNSKTSMKHNDALLSSIFSAKNKHRGNGRFSRERCEHENPVVFLSGFQYFS